MPTIWIADNDIRSEQKAALSAQLPNGWTIVAEKQPAELIVTSDQDITAEMIQAAGSSLKGIARILPGKAKIAEAGIPVHTIYDTGATGVAEHTMMLILALGRRLLWLDDKVQRQDWAEGKTTPVLTDQKKYTYNWVNLPESGQLHGKTVGIVGFGFIGQELARRLNVFNAKILYYDPIRASKAVENLYGAKFVPFDELLANADFLSLHLRFIEGEQGNEKMFSTREFAKMKSTAYFINTSRGRMVDEAALAKAIQSKQIAGAGLDVFEYEPVKPDCPLLPFAGKEIIMTPHVAGTYMQEAWDQAAKEIIDTLREGK